MGCRGLNMLSAPTAEPPEHEPVRPEFMGSSPPQGNPHVAAPRVRPSQPPPAHLPDIVRSVVSSDGHALEERTRVGLENEFGTEFTDVRVHTDSLAYRSATAINANAYTFASHIVFARDRNRGPAGDSLLRHELIHVLQQRNSVSIAPCFSSPGADQALLSPSAHMPRSIQRQPTESDLMLLTDQQLEAEQLGLEGWLQQHQRSDEAYEHNVAYLARIQSVMRRPQPARAARAERQKAANGIIEPAPG